MVKKKGADFAALLTDKTPFAVQEAYKALRTNVIYSLPGDEGKCVGITSAAPSDGKSTTAANLAISLAQIGKRVLLIDCDMRIPTVAALFHIKGTPGLSDFLVGQVGIEEAIYSVGENLTVLPAGSTPPDPTGLLESRQLAGLFTACRKNFDYVVADLPPINTVTDAAILSRHLDGYLLVVRHGHTRYRNVADMVSQLHRLNCRTLGFVSTGVDMPGVKNYRR